MFACPYCGGLYALDDSSKGAVADSASKTVAQWIARVVDSYERTRFAQALAPILDEPCLAALIEVLRIGRVQLPAGGTAAAAELLGLMHNQAAVPALAQAAKDRTPSVYVAALQALAKIGGDAAISCLTDFASQSGPAADIAAQLLIDHYGSGASVSTLFAGLKIPNPAVRASAATWMPSRILMSSGPLAQEHTATAISLLLALLTDEDEFSMVRAASARALGGLRAKEALPFLMDAWKRAAKRIKANDPPDSAYEEQYLIEEAIKTIVPDEAAKMIKDAGRRKGLFY